MTVTASPVDDSRASRSPAQRPAAFAWIDAVKGIAILWIVLNHITEQIFGGPLIANPSAHWAPLGARIAQLAPIGNGVLSIPENILRYVGWAGDQGVGLFIVATGFLLTYNALHSPPTYALAPFLRRRALRLYPLWLTAHLFFVATFLVLGFGMTPFRWETYASALGLRFMPPVFAYFAPAWWYFGLALQLYLIFPFMLAALKRYGATRVLMVSVVLGCALRLIGLYTFGNYAGEWSRGAIVLAQLPVYAFGIALGAWAFEAPLRFSEALRSSRLLFAAAGAYVAGNALSLTLWGMSVAPFLLAASAFFILASLLTRVGDGGSVRRGIQWCGRHSFSIYLAHQPFVTLFVSPHAPALRTVAACALAVVSSFSVALILERAASWGEERAGDAVGRYGITRFAIATLCIAMIGYGACIAADVAVRQFDPQEVNGWGERPSLEPDPVVGWKLRPNETHRLRWVTYDYVSQANALGFPGPLYSIKKPPGTLRIMTLGDAFTSADGVDTVDAWPRVTETLMRSSMHRAVQVMNFGITGYGPNQYAAVTREYAPRYRPDLIVIGMFVNDFSDVTIPDEEFRSSIGFGRASPTGVRSVLALEQLRAWEQVRVAQPVHDALRRSPGTGYFYGGFQFIDRRQIPAWVRSSTGVEARYAQIGATALAWGGRTLIVLFPAPVQVCAPGDLPYYPRGMSLRDSSRFDDDFPQRATSRIARRLDMPFLDLRPTLRAASACPYQPHNMHLTAAGQRLAAHAIARFIERTRR
ncbi:MAG: acyltransferase [Candidatus Eremiobacteraeota bacterium]|nr:acyltransferase [Candidatus Eremiobacteraeota bacterium]